MNQQEPTLTEPGMMSGLEQIDALNELAWELRRQDSVRALTLANEAFALATASRYERGIAYSLLAKAFAQFRLAKLAEARASAEQAREAFKNLEDGLDDLDAKQGLLRAHNTLGIVYGESGELLAALRSFLEADALCKDLQDKQGEADALNNIANVHAYLGDYVSALDYHFQSLAVCKEHPYPEAEGRALLNLGIAYHELGQHKEALEYFERSLGHAKSEPHLHAQILHNLGNSYHKLGDNEKARECLEQSVELHQSIHNELGVSYALNSLGLLELSLGVWEEAALHLQESLELNTRAGDMRGQSETLVLLGRLKLQEGKLGQAREHLEVALALTQQIGNKPEQYQAYKLLSEVYKGQGKLEQALAAYQSYSQLREDILNETSGQHLQSLRVRFEVSQEGREKEIFRLKNIELAEKNDKLNKLNDALQRANAEKTRLLAELERQAKEDALTKLNNRRYFDDVFSKAFTQAQRLHTPLSLAISDIDNFKQVNDRFSHQMGDVVLRTVAQLMKDSVRDIDTVARYGGEEFVVLLPAADAQGAKAVCERIRLAVEQYPWSNLHPDLQITISIGVSDDLGVANADRMMALADDNLYKAKHAGKNQVRV
jgi:diguanylate cyclase (GGDEF)-like protein